MRTQEITEKKSQGTTGEHQRVSLEEFAQRTQQSPFVSIDTEFQRDRSYHAVWCLLQVAAVDEQGRLLACVVDMLDGRNGEKGGGEDANMALVRSVLYEGSRVKVFHAGKQDWEILWHCFGSIPNPVFDSQVAAALLGFGAQCGYERLVRSCLSVSVDKANQYTDWQRRPLSKEQIQYALGDVVYLSRLYPLLRKRLEERCRIVWFDDYTAEELRGLRFETDGEDWFVRLSTKVRGQASLKALRRLCRWREARARRSDKPRQWICSDVALVGLAKLLPSSWEAVRDCRAAGSSLGKNQKVGAEIVEQVRLSKQDEAIVLEEEALSVRDEERSALALLRTLQRLCSEKEGVAMELLGGQSEVLSFLRGGEAVFSRGWRYEVFGKTAEELLRGDMALYVDGGKMKTMERTR